jgi:aspartyl-tRNA(Asn)/glutamyl-tRNA(Gln) amidotransferase subunit B
MPTLPRARRHQFVEVYGLSPAEAALLTEERPIADVFDAVVGEAAPPQTARTAANWILNDVLGLQRARGLPPDRLPLSADQLRELLSAVTAGELTARAAKELLPQIGPDERPREAAIRLNLLSLDDDEAVRAAARETLSAFPAAVADYRSGKQAAIGRLIGETIKRTGGRAKPDVARRVLQEALADEV